MDCHCRKSRVRWAGALWVALGCAALGCASLGCASDQAADGADAAPTPTPDAAPTTDAAVLPDAIDSSAWYEPDPKGRQTEGNQISEDPQMVVLTTAELEQAWEPFARHRTLSGLRTRVVLLEDVVGTTPGIDDAEKVRNYLIEAYARGLRFALMGGDAELLPYRRVDDMLILPYTIYTTNGPTQAYFANLDADWDKDGDGVWGEEVQDVVLADLRDDEIAVGRVPASSVLEVERYVDKLVRYETEPGGRETHTLLFSDIASEIPLLGAIDGAEGVEASVSAFFPQAFVDNARRLYATEAAASNYGGEVLTPDKVRDALDDGYLLAYHNGHGSYDALATSIDSDFVATLGNQLPPVVLSCACQAGNFADVASTIRSDGWVPQGPGDASAGELLLKGQGGGVAYVGNTAVGLGPIGGSQFLHAMFEGLFEKGLATLGEAFSYGRARMREVALTILGVPMVMTNGSERWTQLVVVLLGDPSLRVWTQAAGRLAVTHPTEYGPGYNEMVIEVRGEDSGQPVQDATVVLSKEGDLLLSVRTDAAGTATFRFVPYGPGELQLGVTGPGLVPAFFAISPID